MKPETEEEIEDLDFEFEPTTRSDYIECAYKAIKAVEDMDGGWKNKDLEEIKERITCRSLRIIDSLISEMYGELFDDE